MVKNTKGGKHHKKQKRNKGPIEDGKIVYADEQHVYASVLKKVGGSRIMVACSDTKERSGLIPGKFFKRVWLNIGDILLCQLNLEDDSQCYIVHKYSNKHANMLKAQGKITFDVNGEEDNDNNIGYGFDDPEAGNNGGSNKMLDINNVKGNSYINYPSDSDEEDDIMKNTNHDNKSNTYTKWNATKAKEAKEKKQEENSDDSDEYKNVTLADL